MYIAMMTSRELLANCATYFSGVDILIASKSAKIKHKSRLLINKHGCYDCKASGDLLLALWTKKRVT